MRAIEVGDVCIKTTGREAGEKAVVIKIIDEKNVMIVGPKVRKRKCNIMQLIPLGKKIKVENLEDKKYFNFSDE
ncbi:MAG: 50S ribosomal protein L14e [Candidatus Diapherotrites archaeon]